MMYKNSEYYYDPTAGRAISNMRREERMKMKKIDDEKLREEQVSDVIKIIKKMLNLLNLELIERIALRDKDTGREYR